MDTNAQQNIVNTPVTNSIPDINVPTDLATTDLAALQGNFQQGASGFNLMGEALSKDINARQSMLIGNDFGSQEGSAIGDYNYDSYYESGLAKGSNAILNAGNEIALNEGMRRAKEEAEKRAEEAKKKYSEGVAREQARQAAAAQQAQAQQQYSKADVQNIEIDAAVLKKYGVSSAMDLYTVNPEEFTRQMKRAADAAAGVNDANVWHYRQDGWYSAVDAIYNQFGASAAERQDERTGNQSQASKNFWSRKDVGDAFTSSMLKTAGMSPTYNQERNAWVSQVNTRVQELIRTGGPVDKVSQALSEIKFSFATSSTGNQNAASTLSQTQALIFKDEARYKEILGKLNEKDRAELNKIKEDIESATTEGAGAESNKGGDNLIGSYLNSAGYKEGAAGLYNRALELASKSGMTIYTQSKVKKGAFTDARKMDVTTTTQTITLDGASVVSGMLGLSAEDIVGISNWKKQNPDQLDRYMRVAQQAVTMPIFMADANTFDLEGNRIKQGTIVMPQMPGADELPSYLRLKEMLESKPVIYDDATGAYGWADMDGIDEYAAAYARDAQYMSLLAQQYGFSSNDAIGKAAAINIHTSDWLTSDDKSRDKKIGTQIRRMTFGGTPLRNYENNEDIITKFSGLSGTQEREFLESLVSRSEYKVGDIQSKLEKEKFHGVVDKNISAEDAQALLIVLHTQQNLQDQNGKHVGLIKPTDIQGNRMENLWAGASLSVQNNINFFAGAATGLFSVPVDLINKLNGNASKPGYKSMSQVGYEIAAGDKGLVKFADGYKADLLKVRELENLDIFSGFGGYFSGYEGWRAGGEASAFMASLLVPTGPIVSLSAKAGLAAVKGGTALTKMASKPASEALKSVLVANAASRAQRAIKNTTDEQIAKGMAGATVSLETKAGAGSLKGVDINSKPAEIVDAVLPGSSVVSKAVSNIGDSISSFRATQAIKKTSDETIALRKADIDAGVKPAATPKPSEIVNKDMNWTQELMFKNVNRAQLTHYGATQAAYDGASRWTKAIASAIYNGGDDVGRKTAAEFINKAYDVTSKGGRFTRHDAFKMASGNLNVKGLGGLKLASLLASESKMTAKWIGWEFRSENGNIEHGKYAKYLDENGNFDFKAAAKYQAEGIMMDVAVGAVGYGLAGPAMRAIQAGNATKKLSRWQNIMDAAEDGSKEKLKAMYKVEKWSRAANQLAIDAGSKFITEGNSVIFRDLAHRAEDASDKVLREVTKEIELPVSKMADGSTSISVKDAFTALSSKISYKESYMRGLAGVKNSAGNRFNELHARFKTLAALSPEDSIRMMDEYYTRVKGLAKGATKKEYRDLEIEVFARYGVDAKETRAYRKQYDEWFEELKETKGGSRVSQSGSDGELKGRAIYHPTAGVLTPAHARISDAYAGIDISAGISSAANASLARETIDIAELYSNARKRLDGEQKGTKELSAGDTEVEFNVALANPIKSMHAYRNKMLSDEVVDTLRNSRFKRMDVIKVLADDEFDAMASGMNTGPATKLSRSIRRAKEYQDIADAIVNKLTVKSSVNPSDVLTRESTKKRAESYLAGLVAGDIGPSDIRFLSSLLKDKKTVDAFLEDYTALHVGIDGYEKVYRQVAKDNAIDIHAAKYGQEATPEEVAELDKYVDMWWNDAASRPVLGESGVKPDITKPDTDAPITASTLAEESIQAQYESPAAIFDRMEVAKNRYLQETARYDSAIVEFQNTMFNESLLNKINSTDSAKLEGKVLPLSELIQNSERIQTIMATAPEGVAAKIESALRNSTVRFSNKPINGKMRLGNVEAKDVRKMQPDEGFEVVINPKLIRSKGGTIEGTLGHETMHVYDLVDFDKVGFDRIVADGKANQYSARASEGRANAFGTVMKSRDELERVLGIYDNMLKVRQERAMDVVIAAEKAGVKLDYKNAIEKLGQAEGASVHVADNGVTYVRETDFYKSEMSSLYEDLEKPKAKGKRGAAKDDSEFGQSVTDGIKRNVNRLERDKKYGGKILVDRQYGDMIKTYTREGGDAFARDSIYAKIGDVMNEIQQLQLAAGYSTFNAYTSRQFLSVLGSTVFKNPKQALQLFKVYGHASSTESVRKYLSTPEYAEFFTEFSLRSGDNSILDAAIDVYSPNDAMRTGTLDSMTDMMKANMLQAQMDGGGFKTKAAARARGTMDQVHRVVDEPTFKRFLPILMMQHAMNSYKTNLKRVGRKLDPDTVPGDRMVLDKVLDDTYDEWRMFWELNLGTKKGKGGIRKHAMDTSAKFLSGEARGTTFGRIASGVMFALKYRMTQATRFLNGLAGLSPTNWKDKRYAGSRSLLFSGMALMVAAQVWNYSTTGQNTITGLIDGAERNDSNDLMAILRDFGSMGRFEIGENGTQIDPFFSVFTLQNSIFRESMAGVNMFAPPGHKLEGVQPLGQELGSLLLSPLRAIMDVVGGTYYGYSVWGKNASAIDPETDEPIPYSPLDNAIAISAHLLGLDNFGIGAGLTYDGDVQYGKNARGESITGSGLIQHEYIDAFKAFVVGDAFEGISTALELPFRKNNIDGRARVSLNKNVVGDIRSFKRDYDDAVAKGNLSDEDKDRLYKQFAEKSLQSIRVWNDRYKVLGDRPVLLKAAQRVVMGFLSDEFDERDNRIKNAYWAAKIGQLGGFDQKPNESDEEYEKRSERVRSAYSAQMDKQYAARQVLASLGFKIDGYDYEDMITKTNVDRDSLNFQFKTQVEKGVGDAKSLKSIYEDYSTRIRNLRNAKNYKGAEALEAEYINQFDSIVSPYTKEYGAGILIRNRDFTELAAKYAIIPSAEFRKYSGENGKKYWLQDRYGVGYKNSSALISDSNYMEAYDRLIKDTMKGNSALARAKAEDMLKNIANGRYTVSDRQYNSLIELFSKLRNNQ